ncbi:MAG: orotidine-5'-phosphate decarboxylase [Bdellovibrionales bacterium]|nr:orotidine-5'-phosphate decarboxylase [Bdellovibrionales bacterium]
MIPADKIIVALDTQDPEKLNQLLKALSGEKIWVKIGMEVFYSLGPDVVLKARDQGFKIFLDLKLHDIPNTVAQSLKALSRLPIDMINVHAAGGKEMMQKSFEAIGNLPKRPLLIAVTQLTSTTEAQMHQDQRITGSIEASVLNYAKIAQESHFDGVVSSPLEVTAIKNLLGKNFLTVTPGIRPMGNDLNDQKRVTTPAEALALGTDYMVIGRPITQAANPKQALLEILQGK